MQAISGFTEEHQSLAEEIRRRATFIRSSFFPNTDIGKLA